MGKGASFAQWILTSLHAGIDCLTMQAFQSVFCRFRAKYKEIKQYLNKEADKVINEELSKLSNLEPVSSEFNVTRNYLDWLTSLPWGKHSDEKLELDYAEKVKTRKNWES